MARVRLESVVEQLTNWILIVSGGIGSALGVIDLIRNSPSDAFRSISLLLLGLIALGLGLERMITYKKLEETLESMAGGIYLESWEEINWATEVLVKSAQSQIRATAFGLGKWAGPKDYLKQIAEIAKSREKIHGTFQHKVVFGYDVEPDPERAKHIIERLNIFQEKGVAHMLKMKHLDTKAVVDFLIVDDNSLIIAFPQFRDQDIQVGLKFVDQPRLAKALTVWFDEQVWRKAANIDILQVQRLAAEI